MTAAMPLFLNWERVRSLFCNLDRTSASSTSDAEPAAKQIAGVLRPGGRFVADLGQDGLANWYAMFVNGWWNPTMQKDDNGRDDSAVRYRERQSFENIRDEIFRTAVQNYALSGNGNTADYVRLRVVAIRL